MLFSFLGMRLCNGYRFHHARSGMLSELVKTIPSKVVAHRTGSDHKTQTTPAIHSNLKFIQIFIFNKLSLYVYIHIQVPPAINMLKFNVLCILFSESSETGYGFIVKDSVGGWRCQASLFTCYSSFMADGKWLFVALT